MKESSHSAPRPAKRPQGGDGRLFALASAEAALTGALAADFLPGRLCAAAPLVALAFLLPAWRLRFPGGHRAAFYAPDPLAPDFGALAAEMARRLERAAFGDAVPPLVLSPYCGEDGRFVEYSVDWRPKESAVVVESPAEVTGAAQRREGHASSDGGDAVATPGRRGSVRAARRRVAAPVRLRGAFPIVVREYPATLRFAPDTGRPRTAAFWQDVPVVRPWRESRVLPSNAAILLRLYWTVLLGLHAFRAVSLPVSAWLFLAALPPLAARLMPFLPRLWRWSARQLAFFLRLVRRFVCRVIPVPGFAEKWIRWLEK